MVKIAKLVGASSPTGWSQVHTFFPEAEKKELGVLLAAVAVTKKTEAAELAAFGTEAIQRLHEFYYGETEARGLRRLVRAVEKVKTEFSEVNLAIVAGIVKSNLGDGKEGLYGVTSGQAQIFLERNRKLMKLLDSDEQEGVSGFLLPQDRLVLATGELVNKIEAEGLWGRLTEGSIEEVVDQMTPIIHSTESSLMAGVFGEIKAEKKPEEKMAAEKIQVESGEQEKRPNLWMNHLREKWQEAWQTLITRRGRVGEIYVDQKQKKRRVIGTVILILAGLLAISLVFGIIRQKTSQETVMFNEVREKVERLASESENLSQLNPLRSRALLVEANELINNYKGDELSKKNEGWVREKSKEIEKKLNELMKIYSFDAEVFLDLTLVKDGFEGKRMDFDGEEMVILDEGHKVVLSIGVANKKGAVVGGGELLKGAKLVAVYNKRGFVLADQGVVELDLVKKTATKVIEADQEWGDIGAINVFGGNLYLLDKSQGSIYRYLRADVGFGSKKQWLGVGVEPDFSKVIGMAIDGKIWVLTQSGKIEVYAQGTGKGWEIVGIDTALKEPRAIYTDEDMEKVYILDTGNNRVVVANKQGEYESQYRWEGIKDVTDMVVAEKERKILLLMRDKLYELGLR